MDGRTDAEGGGGGETSSQFPSAPLLLFLLLENETD
jgi:hypothetical protein